MAVSESAARSNPHHRRTPRLLEPPKEIRHAEPGPDRHPPVAHRPGLSPGPWPSSSPRAAALPLRPTRSAAQSIRPRSTRRSTISSPAPDRRVRRPPAARTPAPAIEPVKTTLGQEAWFAGFHVTFNDLTITPNGRYADLNIGATFENLGLDEARLDATIALKSGGQPVRENFDMDIPSVPAGDTMSRPVRLLGLKDNFTLDDAVLTLGSQAMPSRSLSRSARAPARP